MAQWEDVCEAVSPLFYGYNPAYLITFLFVWFYSLESAAAHLPAASAAADYWDTLGYPIALAPGYLPISQNLDWL